MNIEQTATYINAQTIACNVELQAMLAGNFISNYESEWLKYQEEDFMKLIDKYGLSHNNILSLFEMAE